MSKSHSRKEQVEEALWVIVKDRAVHWSMAGLFHVPCDWLFGGLEPFEGLRMKPIYCLLPSAPLGLLLLLPYFS